MVQSDGTLLLEIQHPRAIELRTDLSTVAHLETSPEYFHEYHVTSLSLWNAAQAGWTAARMIELLEDNARYPVPEALSQKIVDTMARYGRVELVRTDEGLILRLAEDSPEEEGDLLGDLAARRTLEKYLQNRREDGSFEIELAANLPHLPRLRQLALVT